jgi:hypothetical protein
MKRIIILAIALILIAITCGKKEQPAIKVSPLKWNETNKYRILIDTTISGSYVLIYKSDMESTMELYSITEVTGPSGLTHDSTAIVLQQNNLKPISSSKVLFTRGITLSAEIKYSKDRASVKAKMPDGEKSIDVPIGINSYDNDEITTILRAVELKPGQEKEIYVVIGLIGTSVPIKINAIGEEKATVPAGEFDCNKYTMTVVGRTIDVWYEKTAAKRMIKYFDAQTNMTMELML